MKATTGQSEMPPGIPQEGGSDLGKTKSDATTWMSKNG
jgi:hypothetical protein